VIGAPLELHDRPVALILRWDVESLIQVASADLSRSLLAASLGLVACSVNRSRPALLLLIEMERLCSMWRPRHETPWPGERLRAIPRTNLETLLREWCSGLSRRTIVLEASIIPVHRLPYIVHAAFGM